jgi:hypothetical protein
MIVMSLRVVWTWTGMGCAMLCGGDRLCCAAGRLTTFGRRCAKCRSPWVASLSCAFVVIVVPKRSAFPRVHFCEFSHGLECLHFVVTGCSFNPAAGTWAFANSLITLRGRHTATVLLNNYVLIVGGSSALGIMVRNAEIYLSGTHTCLWDAHVPVGPGKHGCGSVPTTPTVHTPRPTKAHCPHHALHFPSSCRVVCLFVC